ncbi:MAG: beta strand repeat-containing protein [Burkholderiales bacterium]
MLGVSAFASLAAQERYDYDGLGRLIRVIDEQGRVTEYVHDAAGNILQVITGTGSAQIPVITLISPDIIRRGETKTIRITGTGLAGSHPGVSDPGLDISQFLNSATQATFSLTAMASAAVGTQQITLSNAAGSATTAITVSAVLPKLGMSPLPIAVPPTGGARNFFVSLSSADNVSHTINVASANPAIATVSPASVTIPAGQTETLVSIAGQAAGTTAINLASSTLASTSVPVFITSEFTGLTTSFASPLGVVLSSPPGGTPASFGPIVSPLVGVVVGSYIDNVAPRTLTIGTGPTPLVITGTGLADVTGVSVQPVDGLTLGAASGVPDGRTVMIPVTVAADAPRTVRKIVLAGAQQPYVPARPGADQVLVTLSGPEIFSIDPVFATAGASGITLTVRGRNLQDAQAVTFAPGTGITVSATPAVNTDGTLLTVSLSVSPLAPSGDHVVTVVTPGGSSGTAATSANTLRVASEVRAVYTPVTSPLLGVVKEDGTPPPSPALSASSRLVGVTVGPAITGRAPAAGIIGETVQITFTGNALESVTAVQFSPANGLTIGAPVIGGDGRSVTVSVTISTSAPQTLRALRILAGTSVVPFSDPGAAQFRVTAPVPRIDSISPVVYQTGGGSVTMTVRGINLQGAQGVRMIPPAEIAIAAPSVNAAGTELIATVNVSSAAAAGLRVVVVSTPAGESVTAANDANTVQIATEIGGTYAPVVSPNLGVVLEDSAPPSQQFIGPVISPALGIVLQDPNPPSPPSDIVRAIQVGVAVGSFASGVRATPLAPTSTGTLTISGSGLADVTAVTVIPSTGLTLGALQIAPDGSQITTPVTASSAATGLRGVQVLRGSDKVPFIPAGSDTFRIGEGVPNIDSITPILANRGQMITMVIRGQNFQDAIAVIATPAQGVFIDIAPTVNAAGTEIGVRIGIAADAPEGARVIQVVTPGGSTTSSAVPANTFTVLP